MAVVAWPPPTPPNNRNNGTASADAHPGDHTLIANALDTLIAGGIHSRWHRAGAWSPGGTVPALFPFDTKDDDAANVYNGSVWTVPATGTYLLAAQLVLTTTAAGQYGRVSAWKNGGLYLDGPYIYGGPGASTGIYAYAAFPVRATKNDTIALYYNVSIAGLVGSTGAGVWGSLDWLGP